MTPTAKRAAEFTFFAILAAVTFLMTEAAYRVYLRHELHASIAPKLKDDPAPSFHVWAYPAPWRFDRDLGFSFNEGQWRSFHVTDGAFSGCNTSLGGNRYGNFAPARGDYAEAQVKIQLFGSSYTLRDVTATGNTTTNMLQEALAKELGKSVHILNYSRDSIGLMTMVDMARARLAADKPDLIVFAFNTLGLIYQRNWRFIKESSPGNYRMYQSLAPTDEITPQRTILNLQVVSTHATQELCDKLEAIRKGSGDKAALRTDPVVVEFIREYNAIRRDQNTPDIAVNYLTLRTSFVYNKIRWGDAYRGVEIFRPQTIYAALTIDSYAEDKQFVDAIEEIKKSGIPVRLVHLPALPDLRKPGTIVYGVSSVPAEREKSLVHSLEQLMGQKFVPLTNYYLPEDLANPLDLVESEDNSHPNEKGTRVMAEAFLRYFRAMPFAK